MSDLRERLMGFAAHSRYTPSPYRLAMEAATALAAKDAEIERLRDKVDGLEADLDSALEALWRRCGLEGREWMRLNYPDWVAAKHARTAVLDAQDRRSDIPGRSPPDNPSGGTR